MFLIHAFLFFNSIIVNVVHNVVGYPTKIIRFLHVAFDTAGEAFIAGDHQGNIYVFDLSRNRYITLKYFLYLKKSNVHW